MQGGGSCLGHSIHICLAFFEKQLADGLVAIAGRIVQSRIVAVIPSHGLALLDELPDAFHFVIDSYKGGKVSVNPNDYKPPFISNSSPAFQMPRSKSMSLSVCWAGCVCLWHLQLSALWGSILAF